MTTKKKLLLVIGIIFTPVLALIATILRAAALFTEMIPSSGYFAEKQPLNTAYLWVCVASVFLFTVLAIICRKDFAIPPYRNSLSILFSAAFFLVSLAVAALLSFLTVSSADSALTKFFWLVAACASLIALIYFALFFRRDEAKGTRHAMLGLAPAFFCLFTAMIFYFDRTLQMNAPAKLLHLLAFLLLACFFLTECRSILGLANRALCYLLTAFALLFSLSASIPNLLYNLIAGKVLVLASVYDFVLLAAALYTLARLLQLLPYERISVHRMVQTLLSRAQLEEIEEEEAEDPPADEPVSLEE